LRKLHAPEANIVYLLFAERVLCSASHTGNVPQTELSGCMTNGIKAPVWADVYAPAAHAEVESSLHAPLLKIPKAQGAILSHLTSAMTTRTTVAATAAYSDSTVFKRADTQTSHRAAVRVQMNLGVLRQRIVKRRARGRQRTVGAVSGAVMSTVTISHVLVPMRSVPFWTKK